MLATGVLVAAGSGCGKQVISSEVADVHGRAAAALAVPIDRAIESEGTVLLVHKQGDNPVLAAWVKALGDALDARFRLEVCGPAQFSEEANTSYSGTVPLGEALATHPDAVAVISTLPFEAQDFRTLPDGCPPIFALEWPFPDAAAPLVRNGVVPAGVFEFYPSLYPDVTPDPNALIDGKFLLLDQDSIGAFAGP